MSTEARTPKPRVHVPRKRFVPEIEAILTFDEALRAVAEGEEFLMFIGAIDSCDGRVAIRRGRIVNRYSSFEDMPVLGYR